MSTPRWKDRMFWFGVGFSGLLTGMLFLGLLGMLVVRGAPALDGAFLIQPARDFGASGGIRDQMVGTLLLMTGAGLLAAPLSLGVALFLTEYGPPGRGKRFLIQWLYLLNGTPTILFGLFGFWLFGQVGGLGVSWVSGILILALMILPTVATSFREALMRVSREHREAAQALGFAPSQVLRWVVLPLSLPGLLTGVLLGLARAAGETAAILFTATAFSGVGWPTSFREPVTTLQTHILVLAQEAVDPRIRGRAWGAALVLILLVAALTLLARWIQTRWRRTWEWAYEA